MLDEANVASGQVCSVEVRHECDCGEKQFGLHLEVSDSVDDWRAHDG